ncbi:flagellar basal body-associated FliL family protein [Aestuariispira insulae]|uniref:Flagellar protein FliL n=1 Tax=Aestuariispira insulae TaxID=1461337 RepID=A0A3D9HSN5_9PROT|nr:flagellar basal body-associated FliL family protein [Aestuariispira insulae]RED52460.1 flagellar FliL protein [Aestuariispira insulae]
MSEEAEDIDDADEEGGGGRVSGKKLVLFIALPILLLIGAAAGVFFSGVLDPLLGETPEEEMLTEEEGMEGPARGSNEPGVFVDLDEILVTLNTAGTKQKFLKLQVTFELEKAEDEARIEAVKPRIIDNFQVFLRELRLEELEGSQGVYRIKEELLNRVNQAVHPTKIKDVLFKDMLIQ